MKKTLSAATLLLLFSTVSFADSPDILNSLTKKSTQVIAKSDAAKTRGGYKQCYSFRTGCDYFTTYRNNPNMNGSYVFLTKIATYYDAKVVKFYMAR